jgi:hypothetical protein
MKNKLKKFKDIYSKESMRDIVMRLRQLFESDSGFVLIGVEKEDGGLVVTDAYHNICIGCMLDALEKVISDADKRGFFAKSACEKEEN